MKFDLAMTDELLATTRAVRKRLDLDRKVPREVIMECLELAVQAPTGSNSQGWRWLIVDDPKKKKALADLYRKGGEAYLSQAGEAAKQAGNVQTQRVYESAMFLIDVLHKVPVHLIPVPRRTSAGGHPSAAVGGLLRFDLSRGLELSAGGAFARPRHRADDAAPALREGSRGDSRRSRQRDAGGVAARCVYEGHRFQTRRAAAGVEHHALEHLVK